MNTNITRVIPYKGKELLSPKYDAVFKGLFGRESSKRALKSLLYEFLDLDIKDENLIYFENNEVATDNYKDKQTLYDLSLSVDEGDGINYVIIEIQLCNKYNTRNRFRKYLLKKANSVATAENTENTKMEKVYLLALLDYKFYNKKNDDYVVYYEGGFHSKYEIEKSDIKAVLIELPKVKKNKNINSLKEAWLAFFNLEKEEDVDMLRHYEIIDNLIDELELISADEETRLKIEIAQKEEADFRSAMTGSREEGMEKGMEKREREIAKNLKARNYDKFEISEITGLSISEIESL